MGCEFGFGWRGHLTFQDKLVLVAGKFFFEGKGCGL